ncbi:MAG: IS5 family transposase [Alphaproteobacteria bacterium]
MRFKRWSENGLFGSIFFELSQNKALKMDIVFMDSTTVKMHRHGLGAKNQNIGKNVGGQGTKISIILGKNTPISVQLTEANVHECEPVKAMLVPLKWLGIQRFAADKGYDAIRDACSEFDIKAEIPPRNNRREHRFYDHTLYKCRWRIEAFFGKLKENRRLALRVDKLDTSFLGFIFVALIKRIVC